MIHIRCSPEQLRQIKQAHLVHIKGYVQNQSANYGEDLFQAIKQLRTLPASPFPTYQTATADGDWSWLQALILADIPTLRAMAAQDADKLSSSQFLMMYLRRFSNGPSIYLHGTYNAYTLIDGIGLKVCPYCDEEPAEVLSGGAHPKRTAQLDHFFPKSTFPGLAMCFYNLIPVGASCNHLKLELPLGKNPYEDDIEGCTKLYPDLPLGVNFCAISPQECRISCHGTTDIADNLSVLCLEERYQKYNPMAHRLLESLQNYDRFKRQEVLQTLPGLFADEEALQRILGVDPPDDTAWGKEPLVKLRHDILSGG